MKKWIFNYTLMVDEEDQNHTAIIHAVDWDRAYSLLRGYVDKLQEKYPDKEIWIKDHEAHCFAEEEAKIQWNTCKL